MTTTLEHPPVQQRPQTRPVAGVLDIDGNGKGHLRSPRLLPSPDDLQVPAALIRRHGLRKGDTLEGQRGGPRVLAEIERINGRTPEALRRRPHFKDLTPLHPRDRLRLEHPASGPTGRVMDLMSPVGKGQRGLIVAPPKTGMYSTSFIAFSALAKELGVVIIVPFFEKRMAGIYHNSAYIIDTDGSEAGLYRKMHIPDDPHFYEKFYFTPGDLGFKAFPTEKGKIGTLICWDQWYPEAARLTALQGADVLFYPTAIGWHPLEKEQYGENQHGAWMNVMKGHAVANGVYVAAANRIGLEQYIEGTAGIQFWGSSFIAGPQGEILAQASHDKEEILIAEVDLDLQENVRQNWPFFRDRRIDAFGDITKRAID